MQQLIYAMQFTGRAVPGDGSPDVLRASTSAPSCTITSLVGSEGLAGMVNSAAGGTASFESTVRFTGEESFLESGSIVFGNTGHLLRFSTVGQGYLGPAADGLRHGAITWRVDGGDGQFAEARGLITSNFLVGADGVVTDNHLGVIYVDEH
jgi:hypothetical protein